MAINKKSKNIYSNIEKEYRLITGTFKEISEAIVVNSTEGNLSLNCNKKIVSQGNKK
ncbi:MAG: hypothetical protein ACK5KL_05265 [Dysgonomonas sp.]